MTLKQLLIIIITVILIVGGYYLVRQSGYFSRNGFQNSISSVSSQEKEIKKPVEGEQLIVNEVSGYKLPEGEQLYTISHGDKVTGPRANQIIYNPLPITPNQKQVITVSFPLNENVSSGVIFMTTDNSQDQKVVLKKVEDNSSNTWKGEWTPTDTANTRYNARLYFVGSAGTYNNIMTFL